MTALAQFLVHAPRAVDAFELGADRVDQRKELSIGQALRAQS